MMCGVQVRDSSELVLQADAKTAEAIRKQKDAEAKIEEMETEMNDLKLDIENRASGSSLLEEKVSATVHAESLLKSLFTCLTS